MNKLSPLTGTSRRKVSAEEDRTLQTLVIRYGKDDWRRIASFMPGRSSRQCKERWFHYLTPDIVQSRWTQAEDELLNEKVQQLGHKWKMFEAFFPGRVDVSIKNRYNVLLRQKGKQMTDAKSFATANFEEAESNSSDGIMMWDDEDFDLG
jgi:hypothetical protein